MKTFCLGLFLILSLGCSPFESQRTFVRGLNSTAPQCSKVGTQALYGADNRKDWWEEDTAFRDHWAAATVALVRRANLRMAPEGIELLGPDHGTSKNLCPGTPFADQPEVAFCSGFLVAENLVVTAGHCVRNDNDCRQISFVFDFAQTTATQSSYTVPTENMYQCRKVVTRNLFLSDHALVELDRNVKDRTPLNIRREGKVEVGDDLILIGHPSGIPSKISVGGKVIDNNGRQIYASLDAFAGHSGAPVINRRTGLVEGLLVAGEPDYVLNGQCNNEYVCDEKCRGEIITPIGDLAESIPGVTYAAPEVPCVVDP